MSGIDDYALSGLMIIGRVVLFTGLHPYVYLLYPFGAFQQTESLDRVKLFIAGSRCLSTKSKKLLRINEIAFLTGLKENYLTLNSTLLFFACLISSSSLSTISLLFSLLPCGEEINLFSAIPFSTR